MLAPTMESRGTRTSSVFTSPPEASQIDWLADYPPPRSLPLDREALRVYEHAYAIGVRAEPSADEPPISFSSVLAALLAGQDTTSQWFGVVAVNCGPNAAKVFAKTINPKTIDAVRPAAAGKPGSIKVSTDKQLLTISAAAVLENAEGWAVRVGSDQIGVRHLVAAYVVNPPPIHRAQMQTWGFQESKWRSQFFDWASSRYPAERWTEASRRAAPAKPSPEYALRGFAANSIAFPADADTLTVLDTAAAYHARRKEKDPWLRLQTLFFALFDSAKTNEKVRDALPIWNRISAVADQYKLARDNYFTAPALEGAPKFAAVRISPRVLNTLETARALAVARGSKNGGEALVSVLELAGAVVSKGGEEDAELAKLGLNPKDLRLALIKDADLRAHSGDVWREALGEEELIPVGLPVDLNSDDPEAVVRLDTEWTTDALSIRRDVQSFAALLASKSLEPPLSIGLFGPWGSGKTTFLKRLRQAIDHRADDARKNIEAGKGSDFVGHVVHVEFNAWHFAESALTSSLVDTIFRELTRYMQQEKDKSGEEWARKMAEELESTRRKEFAAKALKGAADAAVKTAEDDLTTKRKEVVSEIGGMQSTLQRLWKVAKKKLEQDPNVKKSGILGALGDTIKSTDALQVQLNTLRTRPGRLVGDLGWIHTLAFAAAVLVAPPLIAWAFQRFFQTGPAGLLLSSVTTMLSVAGVWVRAATSAAARVDRAIAEVADTFDKEVATDPAMVAAQAAVDEALAKQASAAVALQKAQEELARATANAANATIPAQMLHLLSARIDDQDYSKELTTLSLARADLGVLSRYLREQRAVPPQSKKPPVTDSLSKPVERVIKPVERVILYIDDLDRCKPEDVVRVLQMVHMLLAFELFAVVVAVDATWVEEALRQSYPWLEGGEPGFGSNDGGADRDDRKKYRARSHVSPKDYLEKIFQISFWLQPMDRSRASSYIASLVSPLPRESGPVFSSVAVSTPTGGNGRATPKRIGIAAIELDYMQVLAAYLGPSPRRVKRLVNSYRLIKTGLSDGELSKFLTKVSPDDGKLQVGPYQAVISLLVIGTGAPDAAPYILREFAESDQNGGLSTIVEKLRGNSRPQWMMASQVIEMLIRSQASDDASALCTWASRVGRFLLNGQTELRAV